jgi:CheY-like chemotaxis protein
MPEDTDTVFLYVEDDPLNSDVMRSMLNTLGYATVHVFHDSANFLDRLNRLSPKPTVVLLDIHLQPHDGFQMLAMLRAHDTYHDLPVIAVTASMTDAHHRLTEAGFDGCLTKPISWRQFPLMIQKIVNGEAVWDIHS